MCSFVKALVISTAGLFLAGTVYAETPTSITTLTCIGGSYQNVTNEPVYAYALGTGETNPRYFTAYLNGTRFTEWLLDEYIGDSFSSCHFANSPNVIPSTIKIMDVTSVGVGSNVDAGSLSEDAIKQSFVEVDFSYGGLSISNNAVKSNVPVGTPEEQARAFQAFKARSLSLPR